METLNDEGQWIVMMGFLVALGMFMLAVVISQAPLVGQTTAESVIEFPKNEVQDLRGKLVSMTSTLPEFTNPITRTELQDRFRGDIALLSMSRNNAIASYWIDDGYWTEGTQPSDGYYDHPIAIHYNNGITEYDEALHLLQRK